MSWRIEAKHSALQERDIWHIIFIIVINADYNVFGMLNGVMLNVILLSALAPCKKAHDFMFSIP